MKIKFKAYNLLSTDGKGMLKGPMAPMETAVEFCKQMHSTMHGLARISFEDETVHNYYEGPNKADLTGFDTLAILTRYKDGERSIEIFLDMGTAILPVCMNFLKDDDEALPIIPKVYTEAPKIKTLTKEQWKAISEKILEKNELIFKMKNEKDGE